MVRKRLDAPHADRPHKAMPNQNPSSFRPTVLARSSRDSTIWLLGCLVVMLSFCPAQAESDDEGGLLGFPLSLRSYSLYGDTEWMDNGDYRLTQSTLSYKMDFSLIRVNI